VLDSARGKHFVSDYQTTLGEGLKWAPFGRVYSW
jgi:hypothetical protein